MATTSKQLGPYEILRPLGKGGMGTVLVARHRDLGCVRALKVLEAPDAKRIARFEREATALARVRHPSVVRIHDSGRDGSRLYFAMDLVEGRTLAEMLARGLEPVPALMLVAQVARGLHALHEAGIVHRDVKPENVVVDATGTPVVIDLGLAASDDWERLTKTGGVVGTPHYMAPEQLGAKTAPAPANDIWSLGAVLYEALTGSVVFDAATPHQLFAKLASAEVVPPSERRAGLTREHDAVCLRALARDPAKRYATALAFAEDLERLAAGERPAAGWTPPRRVSRLAAVALGLVALAVAGALALARGESAERAADAGALASLRAAVLGRVLKGQEAGVEAGTEALRVAERARARGDSTTAKGAAELAATLALRRHDVAAARSIVEGFAISLEASPALGGPLALLEGDLGRAKRLLDRAIEAEPERGDVRLFRAVARARLEDRAGALRDREEALARGASQPLDDLVVLALAGDPEEARRAIEAHPGLHDPAFARPFAKRAIASLAAGGSPTQVVVLVDRALSYAPPGSPELAAVASAIFARVTPDVKKRAEEAVSIPLEMERTRGWEALLVAANRASPDARSPELAAELTNIATVIPNTNLVKQPLLHVAACADRTSFSATVAYAAFLMSPRKAELFELARVELDRARALARTPYDRAIFLIEQADYFDRTNRGAMAISVTREAIAEADAAGEEGIPLRKHLAVKLVDRLDVAGRYAEGFEAVKIAEDMGLGSDVLVFRSQLHEGTGDLAAAVDDIVLALRTSTVPMYERVDRAQRAERMLRVLGRGVAEIDAVYALIGDTDRDEPRRVALHRAALALERGDRAAASRFLEAASLAFGGSAPAIAALRRDFARGERTDVLRARADELGRVKDGK